MSYGRLRCFALSLGFLTIRDNLISASGAPPATTAVRGQSWPSQILACVSFQSDEALSVKEELDAIEAEILRGISLLEVLARAGLEVSLQIAVRAHPLLRHLAKHGTAQRTAA